MIAGDFDSISKTEIDALVASGEPEGRTIEYKLTLPVKNDDDSTREFLADASSLANAAGGDLIFGIRDKKDANKKSTGIPDTAEGLAGANADQDKLRLLNILRDGLDPRIPGVQIKHIEGFSLGPIIILRIPKSWSAPHMVKYKGSSRFYIRTNVGKHQMDVREIRSAFISSESLAEKIAAFRSERVGKIFAGETPVPLDPLPKIVLHILPIRSFAEPEELNLNQVKANWDVNIKPMGRVSQYSTLLFNFKGLFCHGGSGGSTVRPRGYYQLFRNGAFEATCVALTAEKMLSGVYLEQELMREAPKYIKLLDGLDIGPMFVALSVVAVKGFTVVLTLNPHPYSTFSISPVDEDVLLAPEVLNSEKGGDIKFLLRSALDCIWQASGWTNSQGYDSEGNWGYAPTAY